MKLGFLWDNEPKDSKEKYEGTAVRLGEFGRLFA